MEADFPGSSQYTYNCWVRSRRVHAGCGGLGNGERLQTLPLTSPLYDSRFSGGWRGSSKRFPLLSEAGADVWTSFLTCASSRRLTSPHHAPFRLRLSYQAAAAAVVA